MTHIGKIKPVINSHFAKEGDYGNNTLGSSLKLCST